MSISTFDLFKVGIGPSSSHTVGPMHAERLFSLSLEQSELMSSCCRVKTELLGSLGATGAGHGSAKAIILGLEGESPDSVDIDGIDARVTAARGHGSLALLGKH